MSDPAELSLADLAAAFRRRKVSSAEVTKALLARIKKWQPKINAFARVEAEGAMKAARAADRALANGKIRGPLHGVPLAHKDMYYRAGRRSACGSKLRADWQADQAVATAAVASSTVAANSKRRSRRFCRASSTSARPERLGRRREARPARPRRRARCPGFAATAPSQPD